MHMCQKNKKMFYVIIVLIKWLFSEYVLNLDLTLTEIIKKMQPVSSLNSFG